MRPHNLKWSTEQESWYGSCNSWGGGGSHCCQVPGKPYRYSAIWRIISAVDFWDKNRLKNTFLAHIFQHKLCTVVFRKILSLIFKYMTNLPLTCHNLKKYCFATFPLLLWKFVSGTTINFFRKKIIKYI